MKRITYVHLIDNEVRQMQLVTQKRLFYWTAIGLLINKVTPAADHLSGKQAWCTNIHNTPERVAFVAEVDNSADNCPD
ncbi:hypothetical protein D3C80_2156940 [compost metagenome]